MKLGLEGCVGVHRQDDEKTLYMKLHATLHWAEWAEWFCFAQKEAELRKGEMLAKTGYRPPPDSSSGVWPTAPYCFLGLLSGTCKRLMKA